MIDAIKKYQLRNQSAAEVEILNRDKKDRNKKKEGTSKPSPQKAVLRIKQPMQVEKQVKPPIKILMWTYHNGVKHAVLKRKILSVAEKFTLKP